MSEKYKWTQKVKLVAYGRRRFINHICTLKNMFQKSILVVDEHAHVSISFTHNMQPVHINEAFIICVCVPYDFIEQYDE